METKTRFLSSPGCLLPPEAVDEAGRLNALLSLEILDTAPDPSFDRLTQLALSIFKTEIAVVSFVDRSRQWFKSRSGSLDAKETPRNVAFCAYTILSEEPTVVLDATQDIRFCHNPLVCGPPGIRFYAGVPISSSRGHHVGSLCIIGTQPRTSFSPAEQKLLRSLGDLVNDALEGHRRNLELASNEAEAKNRFALVAKATHDGVWDWDIRNDSVYYSPRWQYILGLPERECESDLDHWLNLVHPDDRTAVQLALEEHLNGASNRFRSEHRIRRGDGSWRWVIVRGLVQRSKSGKVLRMAGSLMDVTRDKTSDSLTGLPNRLLLMDLLSRLIAKSQASQKWRFAVLFVDVDRFKQINDRLGHMGGDMVLRTIAERIQTTVMRTRTSTDSVVARFSGDEFVILLDGVENSSQASGIAKRIHDAVNLPIPYGSEELKVGVSIGITMAKPELVKPESFLQYSDQAMYRAKEGGKGTSVVFDPSIELETRSMLELEDSLRNSIDLNQLRLLYQPQVDLRTGRVTGCEALVRWQHPVRGLLAPQHFIEMAEEIGFISKIDCWVMETACRQLAQWRLEPGAEKLKMSVNVSAHSLAQRGLRYQVESLIAEHDLPAGSLCLELTETVLMDDIEASIRIMHELKAAGVGLHMDDFGSGYSSFKYLHELPFDTLKIDRSFMLKLLSDTRTRSVVSGIKALAQTLGLQVITEGVEDQAQAELLESMGCETGQGYFFAKPLAPEQFHRRFLETHASRESNPFAAAIPAL